MFKPVFCSDSTFCRIAPMVSEGTSRSIVLRLGATFRAAVSVPSAGFVVCRVGGLASVLEVVAIEGRPAEADTVMVSFRLLNTCRRTASRVAEIWTSSVDEIDIVVASRAKLLSLCPVVLDGVHVSAIAFMKVETDCKISDEGRESGADVRLAASLKCCVKNAVIR